MQGLEKVKVQVYSLVSRAKRHSPDFMHTFNYPFVTGPVRS